MPEYWRLASALATVVCFSAPGLPAAEPLSFERDIRPLLKTHCFHCHGEEEKPEGGFDARLVRFIQRGGESGAALVPGNHAESLIYQRIAAGEMPPGDKKLPPEELQKLVDWIDQGAKTLRPEPESLAAAVEFTEEERAHWSFQPVQRPAVPIVAAGVTVRTPIDAFIATRLAAAGLSPSEEADRVTLIRRLSFDLLGLPPTPEEVDRFVADSAPDAYERLVEEMLASPAYGERWARHWLDVAGYADSDGYTAKDAERRWAWKYRDYVIRAFNQDKPWNEFLIEQLAGDELVPPPYQDLKPEQLDQLVATGFLRMAPDGTSDGSADANVARNDVIAETIKITSTSILGLTVGCAQCHTHRYDPITHTDYHRIRSIFEPAYDWKKWKAPNARLVSAWDAEKRTRAAEVDLNLHNIHEERLVELDKIVQETFDTELAKLPAELQPLAKQGRETAEKDRTPEQKQLIKEYPSLNVSRGSVYLYQPSRINLFNKHWDEKVAAAKANRPADDLIHCLTEVPGSAPVAFLFARGDFQQPRQEVPPGELSILNSDPALIPVDDPGIPTSGRRLAYARYLTNGAHPLVGRVIVNRFWMHHFGRGIVATTGDFGFLGEAPSHPELLDWLADEFVRSGWQVKSLHRLIVNSATYRQSSARRDDLDAVDPENRLLGRMSVRRLEAEVLRDSLLQLAGQLSDKLYGSAVPVTPDDVGQVVVGVDTRDDAGRPSGKTVAIGEEEYRRSIYVAVRRTMPLGVLEPFDAPIMTPNCEQRGSSTVAPQSLLLMNNEFVVDQALAMAERLRSESGSDPVVIFATIWRRCFARPPTPEQAAAGLAYLNEQAAFFEQQAAARAGEKPDPKVVTPEPFTLAVATLCQALVSSNGYLYID